MGKKHSEPQTGPDGVPEGAQRKLGIDDGPSGGQFGGGGPEIPSGGWSQDPGFSDGPGYSYEFPPHMGKMDFTGQGEARSETSDLTLTNITGYADTDTGRTHHTATDQHGRVWHWSYAEYDAEKDWDVKYRDTDGQVHDYYRLDDGTWAEDHALEKQDENLAKDHLPPLGIQGEDENLAKGRLPLPDAVEEPAPAPGIQGVENIAKGHLPGLVEEEPPVGQQPEAEPPVQPTPPAEPPVEQSPSPEPPVQPNPPAEPPVEQSPTPNPPAVPGGEGGIPGMGVPYQDFIPLYPMVQDPATGEWRNAQPGEIPKPEPLPPNEDVDQSFQVIDPETGEVISSKPGDPPGSPINVPPGETPEVTEDVNPYDDFLDNIQKAGSNLPKPPFFTTAPDTVSDVPGGPEQQQPEGNDPTQLDPNLLDPIAPGPTLDTGLVDRITQSPGLVEAVNQDPSVAEALERDPTQIDQIDQDLGLAEHQRPMEPSGDSEPSFMDPGPTEQPPPGPSTPDDGADDLTL
jgi:hypothetical protein